MKINVRARTPRPNTGKLVVFRSFHAFGPPSICSRLCPSPDTPLKRIIGLLIVFLLFLPLTQRTPNIVDPVNDLVPIEGFTESANPGIYLDMKGYAILQLQEGSISPQGKQIATLLSGYGISTTVLNASQITSFGDSNGWQVVILDPSCGSSSGSLFPASVVSLLVQNDIPIILLGHASWLLHRLRDTSPPSLTAPLTTLLQASTGYSGAVYLSSPIGLTLGSTITTETGLVLPADNVQTSRSRIEDLAWKESTSSLSPLRYVSYPNDIFLFGPDDMSLLTSVGEGLLVNAIAYATSLRETTTSVAIGHQQSSGDTILGGGFQYSHTPTIESTYHAVHAVNDLKDSTAFSSWRAENLFLVDSILSNLFESGSGESWFREDLSSSNPSMVATAQALWLIEVMQLDGSYDVSSVTSYLSSRQDPDGGFSNDIDITFFVVEALHATGNLGSIDVSDLEWWLRDCVVSGSDTGDSTQWGGIAKSPSSGIAKNSFASRFLLSLQFLGKAHTDPAKLTEWIQTTANGDGSFRDTTSPDQQATLGTASAMLSMSILGTLDGGNRSASLAWFSGNQLPSGSFGIGKDSDDILGKTWTASVVASCLEELSETSGPLASNLLLYCDGVTTSSGFEPMQLVSSLMWTYWLSAAGRYSHAGSIDREVLATYLGYFEDVGFAMYPGWGNMTKTYPAEYDFQQYYDNGVWSQFFGVASALENGFEIPSSMISDLTLYLSMRQRTSGHYRPSTSGTASIQYSVAAIETLFLLDELDTIWYRSALETAILNEYSAGQWSRATWNLMPFANLQPAVDFLSTRAALRLGIVDASMANALVSNIASRVQYNDLYALSWDVSTIALLNESGWSASLSIFDREQVLTILQSCFGSGWFNETSDWQPILTSQVLEMTSVLGLRARHLSPRGCTISVSAASSITLGGSLSVDISISSPTSINTVLVNAFGQWIRFENVLSTDSLLIQVPSSESILGTNQISIMLSNFGYSRGYDSLTVEVLGALEGNLELFTPEVVAGNLINGTASWVLQGGGDAGTCSISIRLSNGTQYQEWNYVEESPFVFSVPTSDCSPGTYNLSVTIGRSQCQDLVLWEVISIVNPEYTYITSSSNLEGDAGYPIYINWTLRFSSNGTGIAGENVSIEIKDATESVVFSDNMVSTGELDSFIWTSYESGIYSFRIFYDGVGSLVASNFQGNTSIYHITNLELLHEESSNQYSNTSIIAYLETSLGTPLADQAVHITVTAPDASIVLDAILTTNGTGHVSTSVSLGQNGYYSISGSFAGQGLQRETSAMAFLLSWSTTDMQMGGISSDTTTASNHILWSQILDVGGFPIAELQVQLTITYLPSTVVLQQDLIANETGFVSIPWSATNPGSYHIVFSYPGSASRGAAFADKSVTARILTSVSVDVGSNPEVGINSWIFVTALDDFLNPVDVDVFIIIRDADDQLLLNLTEQTTNGILNLTWTPVSRGINNITIVVPRQSWYESSQSILNVGVREAPQLNLSFGTTPVAPSDCEFLVRVLDNSENPIPGVSVSTLVLLDGIILYDGTNSTPADGIIHIWLAIINPGNLSVLTEIDAQGWLVEASNSSSMIALGDTSIALVIPGQPIEQGTTLGVTVMLEDWTGSPLTEVPVIISVLWINGSLLDSAVVYTGSEGSCSTAFTFTFVADFWIRASYTGTGLNASATVERIQRVRVTPLVDLFHDPTSIVGDEVSLDVGLRDAFGDFIAGRSLLLSITMNGTTVYETSFLSSSHLMTLHWSPVERGLAIITLSHAGDEFYLTNLTTSSMSILTLVSGDLILELEEIDVYESVLITYNLTGSEPMLGVEIVFQVLGMDLVPVWTATGHTNSSGFASAFYTAIHSHGILQVIASPAANQFMLGGDAQESLKIWTYAHVETVMSPSPPTTGSLINVTVSVTDDLGNVIDGLRVAVSLYDIYNSRLFTVYRDLVEGVTAVQFTPVQWGIYRVDISSSGSETVHPFDVNMDDHMHTVYCPTLMSFIISSPEVEVGDPITIVAHLENVHGDPLVGMTINLSLVGDSSLGPVALSTDDEGDVVWIVTLEEQGFWELRGYFYGLGTYLPSQEILEVHSCYGTSIQLALENDEDPIAGDNPLNVSFLLVDSIGTPLEGRTITWEAYHHELGLLSSGSIVQLGIEPETVLIQVDVGGNITIVFSFAGSDHYHSSNAALDLVVKGTSEVVLLNVGDFDRAEAAPLRIEIIDELGIPLEISSLAFTVTLEGFSLVDRLYYNGTTIYLNLTGLTVGNYSLNVTVPSSALRVGCELVQSIRLVTQTTIFVSEADLSGHVGVGHSLSIGLVDSTGAELDDLILWVSLYHPDGREIYGGLETSTPETLQDGRISVFWLPSSTGNYSLLVRFVGDEWTLSSEWNLTILTRRAVSMEVEHPLEIDFSDEEELTVTISNGFSHVVDAEVILRIMDSERLVFETMVRTDYRGIAEVSLPELLAGDYSIRVSFEGSDVLAPQSYSGSLRVLARVLLSFEKESNLYAGSSGTATVSSQILGVGETWNGSLLVRIVDPDGSVVFMGAWNVTSTAIRSLEFTPPVRGTYRANITLHGLPAMGKSSMEIEFNIGTPPMPISLDVATTPVAIAVPIVGILALVIRKRFGVDLPSEWTGV